MNIHHLELFFYVAKHQGISEAVRNIPYGIQQPAVSAQVLQLEDSLGMTLFQRRPFRLTPAGEKVFEFIRPFFDGLGPLADELREEAQQIRVGGSGVFLQDHLPWILQRVREKFPKLRLLLREGHRPDLEASLKQGDIDVATTLLDNKPPAGINALPLLKLPLVLLAPKSSRLKSAEELWERDRIEDTLICLPPTETIPRHFQEGLRRLGVEWSPRIEVNSLALIQTYVENGYGIGLHVGIPKYPLPAKIKALPLLQFEPVILGALWQGKATPIIQALLDATKERVRLVAGEQEKV